LDNAEREKLLLAEKMEGASPAPKAIQEQPSRRRVASRPGLHGTVLAVNRAYNFVVLNLGGRQGVETNAEMVVMRGGTLIGKIRVSSVEPATAIGDIISSTLPRGVQVQPGDIVIYAGTDS
jgi:cell shape-determining protein MreC